jgi:superfamily II DNA/RNA helicase
LLLEIAAEGKVDLAGVNVLVVDDINLIKKKRQLNNFKKILEQLPAEKQNIVFTNRRSRETQQILDQILKAPAEIKVDRAKEDEASASAEETMTEKSPKIQPKAAAIRENVTDREAVELARRYKTFGDKTPSFLLTKGALAKGEF